MNPNSQAQVNLTTQTTCEDNSANDYIGNRFSVVMVVGIFARTTIVVMVQAMVVVEVGLLMYNVDFVINLDMVLLTAITG